MIWLRKTTSFVLSDGYLYDPNPTECFYVGYEPENADYLRNRAVQTSFTEIKRWIFDNYGFKVASFYVAEVKRDHGIPELGNCKPLNGVSSNGKSIRCPPEKRATIEAALRHFGMI